MQPKLGSQVNPADSCSQLALQGTTADGIYFIKASGGAAAETYCALSATKTEAHRQFDFGAGADGDINLNGGTHTIESLFDGYSWKDGKIPQWGKVTLANGAVLTCNE